MNALETVDDRNAGNTSLVPSDLRETLGDHPNATLNNAVAKHTAGNRPVMAGAQVLLRALWRREQTPQNIWLAGPGGLNEPLTLMLLAAAAGCSVDILATDLSDAVVADISAGRLVGGDLAHLPRGLCPANTIFADDTGHRFARDALPNIRLRAVGGNLSEGTPAGAFDVVVCRRVLHHFRAPRARQFLGTLLNALHPEGCLILDAVDALAVGLPLTADDAVALDPKGRLLTLPTPPPLPRLSLATVVDPESRMVDRERRELLVDALRQSPPGNSVHTELTVTLAALDIRADDDDSARTRLHDLGESQRHAPSGDDLDVQICLALLDLRRGRPALARSRLDGRVGSSWLGTALLARAYQGLHLSAEARRRHSLVLPLLDGGGDAPAALTVFVPACHPTLVRRVSRDAARGDRTQWHGL